MQELFGHCDGAFLDMYEKYGKQDEHVDPLAITRRVTKGTMDERARALRPFKRYRCAAYHRSQS